MPPYPLCPHALHGGDTSEWQSKNLVGTLSESFQVKRCRGRRAQGWEPTRVGGCKDGRVQEQEGARAEGCIGRRAQGLVPLHPFTCSLSCRPALCNQRVTWWNYHCLIFHFTFLLPLLSTSPWFVLNTLSLTIIVCNNETTLLSVLPVLKCCVDKHLTVVDAVCLSAISQIKTKKFNDSTIR